MKTKLLSTMFLAWTFIFQNVAFAMKPIEVSSQSDINKLKAQKITEKISQKYQGLSVAKKLKLLKRTEKRLSKGMRKLNKMSDHKFQSKMNGMLSQKSTSVKAIDLDPEESSLLDGIVAKQNVASVSVDKFLFAQKIEDSIFSIREEIDSLKNGEKKLTVTTGVIYGIIAGLVVLSFFSSTALVILGIVFVGFVILLSLLLLVGFAFAQALGGIVGQLKHNTRS